MGLNHLFYLEKHFYFFATKSEFYSMIYTVKLQFSGLDWSAPIVRYFGVVRYFWTYVLLHKLTICHRKLHICHLVAMKLSIWRLNMHFQQNHNVLPPICRHNYTYSSSIFKKYPYLAKTRRFLLYNLKFFVRYFGVFGFPNCQMSAKFGPIYFNKNWSAEKCPLNWSCPLFLESAKLEFH